MSRKVSRIVIGVVLVLALGLVVGAFSADRLGDGGDETTEAVTTEAAVTDPHPLSTGTTPDEVKTAIFERAYSECASTGLDLLVAKYKIADKSKAGVANAVGRAWASYFDAGRDALPDGRDGCLQGLNDPASE